MRKFKGILRRYVTPYRGCLGGSVALNILSAVLNVFSFALIVPILRILFKINDATYGFIPWDGADSGLGFRDILTNNAYWAVTDLIGKVGQSGTLLLLCVFLCVVTLLKTAAYFGASAVMIPLRTGVVRDLRRELYSKLLTLHMGFFSKERKGDIIARMSGDVTEVETSVMSVLDMLIKNPILIAIYFAALLLISWKLTLFTILVVPLLAWLMGKVGRTLKRTSLSLQSLLGDTLSSVEETLGGLRIIKAFVAEEKMEGRFESLTDALRDKSGKVATRQALAHPLSEFLGTVLISVVLWFGGTLILGDKAPLDASQFIYYMMILYSIINPIKEFSKAGYSIPKGLASMERIDAILTTPCEIKMKRNPVKVNSFTDSIVLKDVSFSYSGGPAVLDGINLTIPRGVSVALVGQSGAGKSTILDLLLRFYDVTGGSILIDGTDIRDMDIASLRSLFGYVSQDPVLFNDTIANNIAFARQGATREDVERAARAASAHEFILEKEHGYDTNIGEDGTMLSGGQRQRLSIARALLGDPPILLLDEATSSLDSQSEKLVQDALRHLRQGRTTITVAHRLSTIRDYDLIVVIQDGKIIESGTHESLLSSGGYYRRLFEMQTGQQSK